MSGKERIVAGRSGASGACATYAAVLKSYKGLLCCEGMPWCYLGHQMREAVAYPLQRQESPDMIGSPVVSHRDWLAQPRERRRSPGAALATGTKGAEAGKAQRSGVTTNGRTDEGSCPKIPFCLHLVLRVSGTTSPRWSGEIGGVCTHGTTPALPVATSLGPQVSLGECPLSPALQACAEVLQAAQEPARATCPPQSVNTDPC